jgi:hypothetical protein
MRLAKSRKFQHSDLAATDVAQSSQSVGEAKARVRSLYRKIVRDLPRLLSAFDLDNKNPQYYYGKVKERFYEHGAVKDPRYIDILRARGEMDYQECCKMYATKSHLAAYAMASPGEMIQTKYDSDIPALEEGQTDFLTDFLKR